MVDKQTAALYAVRYTVCMHTIVFNTEFLER